MGTTTNPMTLWQAIDALARQVPFTRSKVQAALSVALIERDNPSNELFQFYKSNPVKLAEGVEIENVDLRVKRSGGHPGLVVLSTDGACVSLGDVRARYGDLEITGTPRGRSLDEETMHSTQLPWGKLSFGFRERKPDCLSSVVLNPRKDG